MKTNPPHVRNETHKLREIRVGRWGGFVFINFNKEAPPLEAYLGALPQQMERSEFDRQYISGHYVKVLPCNWKAAIEAFIEAYHVAETHHQTALISDEWATQYDFYPHDPHFSRFLEPLVVAPNRRGKMSEQELLSELFRVVDGGEAPKLPEGMTARAFAAKMRRDQLSAETGRDFSALSDAETIDSLQYLVFPNTVIFRGYGVPAIYRFRPNGNDPDTCIFDLFVVSLVSKDGIAPFPPEPVKLGDGSFSTAYPLPPWLGHVFDQDVENLGLQQQGLKAATWPEITLSRYQEVRIRHFHNVLDTYLNQTPGK